MAVTQNNTYRDGGVWNAALNALPKDQRKAYKCTTVVQPMRQAVGTPMYRPLNIFVNSVSPTVGHPWSSTGNQQMTTEDFDLLTTEESANIYTE